MDLHAIVYVSSATTLPDSAALRHLLLRARQRNLEHGITGLLMYADGNFMQYIEGPLAPLMHIYQLIRRDPMHHTLIEMFNEAVPEREFCDWAMAYRTETLPSFLQPRSYEQRFAPQPPLGPGRQLLQSVWRDARSRLV